MARPLIDLASSTADAKINPRFPLVALLNTAILYFFKLYQLKIQYIGFFQCPQPINSPMLIIGIPKEYDFKKPKSYNLFLKSNDQKP